MTRASWTIPQKITTAGNATLIAYDGAPVLSTDPWIGDEDPAYFGSWVLSHRIPADLKNDVGNSKYLWFSHGHPDHLNPISLQRYKSKNILLPDHVNARILSDISRLGFKASILPDRKWVHLSRQIKVQCITTAIQDAILLVDVCGKLFINLNDSGARDCATYIKDIAANYTYSYAMALAGYGDADMINFYDENDNFILPLAAGKPLVGKTLSRIAEITGAKSVIPFSSFHQYQRADSIWAREYTTPVEAYRIGLSEDIEYVSPFCTIDCNDLATTQYNPRELEIAIQKPETFGDSWSDELTFKDKKKIEHYFSRKERIQKYFGFVNFRVGGKEFLLKMGGITGRGISFSVPRNSLMIAIEYRIFDDLLIGNFMKTTLHNCGSLYEGSGNFVFNAAKYGDNGLVETEAEIDKYLSEYKRRSARVSE